MININYPDSYNLNPSAQEIREGISLVTAVKNRKETLEEALKTWIAVKQIDEIIIVDWTSDESLIPLVKKINDTRIVLIIVENQERWIQTKAFNLGVRFTSMDKVMKIDGDIKINQEFFNKHSLKEGVFYTGNWALGRNSNETHLNGTVFLFRKDFFKVNGYNELFKLYGYDDTDLYTRLEKTGLHRLDFNNDYLYHIEHENRVSAIELSDHLNKLTDSQKADISILMNRHLLTQSYSWSETNQMIEMNVQQIFPKVFLCKQLLSTEPAISDDLLRQSLDIALKERLHLAGQQLSNRVFETGTRNEIIDLYYIFQNKNENQEYKNTYNLIYKYDQAVIKEILKKDLEINTLNEELQIQYNRNKELKQRINAIYSSYSWRFGHSISLFFSKLAFWSKTP